MKVFVAGGTGVLGRRAVRALSAAGHETRATARNTDGEQIVRRAGATPVSVDLFNADEVRAAVAGSDAVLRLTTRIPGLRRVRFSREWVDTGRLRNESARLIASACVTEGVAVYVHESVTFLYADGGDAWLDEVAPLDTAEATPLQDAEAGEQKAQIVTDAGGRGIVLRFAGFYAADSVQSLELATLMQRRRFTLVGPSRNYFSSIHVTDAAAAVVAALDAPAGVYNVADDKPMPLRDNLAALARAVDAPPMRRLPAFFGPFVMGQAWSYLSRSQRVSAGKLHEATGWKPTIPDARTGWELIAKEWALESQR